MTSINNGAQVMPEQDIQVEKLNAEAVRCCSTDPVYSSLICGASKEVKESAENVGNGHDSYFAKYGALPLGGY